MLFNLILSVILLTIGILTKLKAKRYRKYISLVVNYKTSDLTEISNKMKEIKKSTGIIAVIAIYLLTFAVVRIFI